MVVGVVMGLLLWWGRGAVEVGGGDAAVDEEVAAGDPGAIGAEEEVGDGGDLVRRAGAAGGALFEHAPVPLAAWSGELVDGEGGDDDAGADGVDACAALGPTDGF